MTYQLTVIDYAAVRSREVAVMVEVDGHLVNGGQNVEVFDYVR